MPEKNKNIRDILDAWSKMPHDKVHVYSSGSSMSVGSDADALKKDSKALDILELLFSAEMEESIKNHKNSKAGK